MLINKLKSYINVVILGSKATPESLLDSGRVPPGRDLPE